MATLFLLRHSSALVSLHIKYQWNFYQLPAIEEREKLRCQGDMQLSSWIDGQLKGAFVTVVLGDQHSCSSRWVRYEIEKSIEN